MEQILAEAEEAELPVAAMWVQDWIKFALILEADRGFNIGGNQMPSGTRDLRVSKQNT